MIKIIINYNFFVILKAFIIMVGEKVVNGTIKVYLIIKSILYYRAL